MIKLLLTSSGITNQSIHNALTGLLGKPISECKALFVPTGVYPFEGGPFYAGQAIYGSHQSRLAQLGWEALGILELTSLPSIDKDVWASSVKQTDALLVWGGDPLFLAYWFRESGLTDLLLSLDRDIVYVGVSAGAMAAASTICESYSNAPAGRNHLLTSKDIVFQTPDGEINRKIITAQGVGLVYFAIIPHFENKNHPDAVGDNAAIWAAHVPMPVYAIDDQTAIKVSGDVIEVVSEGEWKLFNEKKQ